MIDDALPLKGIHRDRPLFAVIYLVKLFSISLSSELGIKLASFTMIPNSMQKSAT